jgi:hypothetical protein
MSNNKQRLFEVMGKIDNSFKPKLNEEVMNSNIDPKENLEYFLSFNNDDIYWQWINGEIDDNQAKEIIYDTDGISYDPNFNYKEKYSLMSEQQSIELNPEEVLNSYLETALWAEGGDGNELDSKTINDIDERAKQASLKDIQTFIQQAQQQAPEELANYDARALGHYLWLSRNGHGAGFFDDNNDTLQNIARAMKTADIYVGDDGKVYIMGTESNTQPEQPMNEMPNWGKNRANPAYTHFAVLKTTGKIVNGWDYKGYDQDELRADKKYYFLNDIKDNQIDPKAVVILTKKYLLAHGTNPYDYANWHKNDTDGTDIYTM